MKPLPFYALVRTRGSATQPLDPARPTALGVVLGRSGGPDLWNYAVMIGQTTFMFTHADLIPLGWVVAREVVHGSENDLEAVPHSERVASFDTEDLTD